ncbi:unnamed protein product [Urochloa humidicola]
MAGDKQQQQQEAPALHLVVFPWLAFGHLIPFLELSKRLAARGHSVTFVSTPRNIARLPPVPAAGLSGGHVRMVALPLPAVDGLPEGAESTTDLPPEKVELLKAAFDGLAAPFAEFLAAACAGGGEEEAWPFARRPDWIVLDFAHYWLCPIADLHQIPCAMFLIFTATAMAYMGSRQENVRRPRVAAEDFMPMPPWFPSPPPLAFRRHEAAAMAAATELNASGVADTERLWRTEERCRLLVVRSCPEAEPRAFPLLAGLFRKPVLAAGLLLPEVGDRRRDDSDGGGGALRWLDAQPPRSVVYVALGSEAPVTVEAIRELAAGLELSGARFLWALRAPVGGGGGAVLPDGFEKRVAERGVVITGWVPQVHVLAHGAVGAFLTHCGWGSAAEGLFRFCHPLVMLPFVADQGLIARIMAEHGVGVEVARREEDGWFGRDDVAAAVRRVMVGEEGKLIALNARMLSEVFVGDDSGQQERYIDELVDGFRRHNLIE